MVYKYVIVVPVFRRLELTIKFLDSVQFNLNEVLFVIIDDSPTREHFDYFNDTQNIKVLTTEQEAWWCGCTRIGLHYLENLDGISEETILVIANNDVELGNCDWTLLDDYLSLDNTIVHPVSIDQDGKEISSGCKVISWFPYVTNHPKNFNSNKIQIDLCTARFLCMKYKTYKRVGNIAINLIQYHGDNDFSFRAKKLGVNTYIVSNLFCTVHNLDTGTKEHNTSSFTNLLESFNDLKSPNNISSRYNFISNHFNKVFSVAICLSMTLNTLVKFIFNKFKK